MQYIAFAAPATARGETSFDAAVGDGVTSDQTAIAAAAAALLAGTSKTLKIGAATYLGTWNFAVPGSTTVQGQGQQSIVKVTGGAAAFTVGAVNDVNIKDLKIQGDGTVNANAYGIMMGLSGVADSGPQRATIQNVQTVGFWAGGFLFRKSPLVNHMGPRFIGCVSKDCGVYGFFFDQQGEYAQLLGCEATGSTYGVWIGAGNISINGGNFSNNSYGIYLDAGTNAAHGTVVGATINHNSTANVYIAAIDIGHTFVGCDMFAGAITAVSNTALVDFTGCRISPTAINCTNGMMRFMDCEFDNTSSPAVTTSGTGWVEFVNCRGSDGNLPTYIRTLVDASYTFSSDANKTLTSQQSVAETLTIVAGTLTATRTLTSAFGPSSGRKQRIVNNNAQSVTFLWSSGTGVTIAPGGWAWIYGDGTNAVKLES